jgi:putative sterol carrier protein
MSEEIFTEPWARDWAEQLNHSEAYHQAARDWHGSICFQLRDRDPAKQRCIFLDLEEGVCRGARVATAADRDSADYVLSARERVWRRVIEGRTDPLVALMTGQIKFERGRLMDFAEHTAAAKELMKAAQRIA